MTGRARRESGLGNSGWGSGGIVACGGITPLVSLKMFLLESKLQSEDLQHFYFSGDISSLEQPGLISSKWA